MIKTVFLSCDYPGDKKIDDKINSWFTENPDIKLIDIKFQSNVSAVADSGVSAEYWHTSALIIYKPLLEKQQPSANSKGTGYLIKCDKCGELKTIKTKDAKENVCYECKGEQND
nr:MAG TPA: Sporulation protein Cse60 [Caudoviricetes sp.]